jgi:hypothetical protein
MREEKRKMCENTPMIPARTEPTPQPSEPKEANFPRRLPLSYAYASSAEGNIPPQKPTRTRLSIRKYHSVVTICVKAAKPERTRPSCIIRLRPLMSASRPKMYEEMRSAEEKATAMSPISKSLAPSSLA